MGGTKSPPFDPKEQFRVEAERLGLKTHAEILEHAIREYVISTTGKIRVRKLDWGVLAALSNVDEGVANAINRQDEFATKDPVSPVVEVLLALLYVCRDKAALADKEADRRDKAKKIVTLRGGIGDAPAPAKPATVAENPATVPDVRIANYEKLRAAVEKAGFGIGRTSGDWFINGVREYDKRMEADDLNRAKQIVNLEVENRKLRESIKSAGFGLTEDGPEFQIYDVSDRAKEEAARAARLADLERENENLRIGMALSDPCDNPRCEACSDNRCPCNGSHVSSDCFCERPLVRLDLGHHPTSITVSRFEETPADAAIRLIDRIKAIVAECGGSFFEIIEFLEGERT